MRDLKNVDTPCLIVDLDKLEKNIEEMAQLAKAHHVELWPMIKTHKSEDIVKLQLEYGARGVLVAKLGEAEEMVKAGVERVILGYPIIGEKKLQRLIELSQKAQVICSIDSVEAATLLNNKALEENIIFQVVILIDSGLKRLGVTPEAVKNLYKTLKDLKGLRVIGVGTHGGHVYGAVDTLGVEKAAGEELEAITKAAEVLQEEGVDCEIIALGSTPTVKTTKDFKGVKQIRPGNYVFYDAIQVALGIVPIERCALRVLATVISVPEPGRAIMDAGSKILGLDAGAHGNDNIRGYGRIKGHENVLIKGLSEELGKLLYDPQEDELKVGEVVEIIPNHACSVVNMVDRMYGVRNNVIEKEMIVNARGLCR